MEAIALAESGDESKLKALLESMDQQAWSGSSPITSQSLPQCLPQSSRIDLVSKTEYSQEKNNTASWETMIQGANQRAEKEAKATTAVNTTTAAKVDKAIRSDTAIESDASKKQTTQRKQATDKKSLGKQSAIKANPNKLTVPLKMPRANQTWTKRKLTKFGLDVWVSLAVHGVLLVILGLWVVVTIQNTPVLSVVAATVESNDVLMEIPAESVSQLDSTSTDSSSIETPETSDIKIDIDTNSVSVEKTDLGILAPSQASSISQQISKAGAPGNKMVEGAEFFGSKAIGNRFVYVVDASPSMRRDRAFDAAKEEILRSLRSMKPKQRFAILFFGGTVDVLELDPGEKIDQPQSATPENIEKAIRWLAKNTIQKEGKPPVDAIKSALELQPDGIFLLFDGDTKLDNWTQIVRQLNTSDGLFTDGGTKVPIHVIHFFRDEFQRSMQRLAEENGGTYRFVPKSNFRLQP
jgi:hypothetical protein